MSVTKLRFVLAGVLAMGLAASHPAFAAKADGKKAKKLAALIAKYDKDGNGVIDGDERDALRKDFAANPTGELAEFDTDHDGKLSDEEIAAIKMPAAGGKKKGADGEKAKGETPKSTDSDSK